jgi:hypothetical protein
VHDLYEGDFVEKKSVLVWLFVCVVSVFELSTSSV